MQSKKLEGVARGKGHRKRRPSHSPNLLKAICSMVSLKKNFLFNASYQVLTILIPLITVPYLSRILGAEGVGAATYTQSIANYFVLFAMMGMSTYGVREMSSSPKEVSRLSRTFSTLYCCQLLFSVPILLIYIIYVIYIPGEYPMLQWCWVLWVASASLDVSWLFFGLEDFRLPTVRSFLVKLIQLVLLFVFVRSDKDLLSYVLLCAVSLFLTQLSLWPFLLKKVKFVKVSIKEVLFHIKPNLVLFLPVIAISLYTLVDKIMLGQLSSIDEVGFYEYSERVCKMPLTIVTALGTVMLPRMASLYACDDPTAESAAGRYIEKSVVLEAFAGCGMGAIIAGSSFYIANVFFGPSFGDCAPLLAILAGIIPIMSISNVFGSQCLLARGKDMSYTAAVTCGAISNIILNLILIPRLAALGAAVATLFAELVVLFSEGIMLRQFIDMPRTLLHCLPFVLAFALASVGVYLITGILNESWLSLILALLASSLAYCLLALPLSAIFNNPIIGYLRSALRRTD